MKRKVKFHNNMNSNNNINNTNNDSHNDDNNSSSNNIYIIKYYDKRTLFDSNLRSKTVLFIYLRFSCTS